MKESSTEWEQINKRRLSSDEIEALRYALRQTRRDLCFEAKPCNFAAAVFDVMGVDASKLVPDIDGDAPDRLDGVPLDWRWADVSTDSRTPRYHQTQQAPKVGDRVRRLWSSTPGIVSAFRRHGKRGYQVRVTWPIAGPPLYDTAFADPLWSRLEHHVAMSQLVLVAGTLATHVVHFDSVLFDTACEQPRFISNDLREVTCPDCLTRIDRISICLRSQRAHHVAP